MRAVVIAAALVVGLAATVQLAAGAAYGELAVDGSLPRRLAGDWPLRAAVRLGLDRVAPMREPLARAAIFRGDAVLAHRLLDASGPSATVDDLRGRLALRDGDSTAALRWFEQAGDFVAARAAIDALAQRDPRAAYALIRAFDRRLTGAPDVPEIAAEVLWREGQIAAAIAYAEPAQRGRYDRLALDAYRRALERAPNEETYLLAFGYQSLVLADPRGAREAYAAAARVVPDSVDAFVGLAAASADLGDCAAARAARTEARVHAPALRLEAYGPLIRAALARCGR
jgi:predicted Zn-dependent protease